MLTHGWDSVAKRNYCWNGTQKISFRFWLQSHASRESSVNDNRDSAVWLVYRIRSAEASEALSRCVVALRYLGLAFLRRNIQPGSTECYVGLHIFRGACEEKSSIKAKLFL
jgi:hypothetical protein